MKQTLVSYSVFLGTAHLACSMMMTLGAVRSGMAQPIPDATLGLEQSQVDRFGVIDLITGGATRGTNLFHSFERFSILAGEGVYFDNPAGITAILGRVTGADPSEIEGGLGVLGEASLFLLNPNGVLFGPDAVLDIPGSLVVSTADQFIFADATEFSAIAPSASPLLTISSTPLMPSAPPTHGTIVVNGSELAVGEDITFSANQVGFLEGGYLYVSGTGGGNIAIQAEDVSLLDGSALLAGIETGEDAGAAIAGNIEIQATGDVLVEGGSAIVNSVGLPFVSLDLFEEGFVELAQGEGGNISLQANNLTIRNAALVATTTSGRGNAGNVNLTVTDDILLEDLDSDLGQGLGSAVNFGAEGNAGNITLNTQRLTLNRAQMGALTAGEGNAGDVFITASDSVLITGVVNPDDLFTGRSGIFSTVEETARGQGGDIQLQTDVLQVIDGGTIDNAMVGIGNAGAIQIDTRLLEMTQGGAIDSATIGLGDAGKIIINAQDIVLDGNSPELGRTGLFSTVEPGAIGNGGAVEITAKTLLISNGAVINAGSFAIDLEGDEPLPTQGDAGKITLNIQDWIELRDGIVRSDIGTSTVGNAGGIEVLTGRLRITKGGIFDSGIDGLGDSAPILINARESIEIDGEETGISNQVLFNAVGNSLGIDITTPRLTLLNSGRISTATGGNGDAGPIRIETTELTLNRGVIDSLTVGPGAPGEIVLLSSEVINLENGQLLSSIGEGAQVQGFKPPGSITVQTPELRLSAGSSIQAQVSPNAEARIAGNITVLADNIQLEDSSEIQARAASQDGGNLDLQASSSLLLRNGSSISTSAGTAQAGGDGGNIRLNAPFIIAVPNEDSDITANAFEGNGGNIDITAQSVLGLEFRATPSPQSDITASSELGLNGTVALNTPELEPGQGLNELPSGLVDPSDSVARRCAARTTAGRSSLSISGTGGLPARPGTRLGSNYSLGSIRELSAPWAVSTNAASSDPLMQQPQRLQEAGGWQRLASGDIRLVGEARVALASSSC